MPPVHRGRRRHPRALAVVLVVLSFSAAQCTKLRAVDSAAPWVAWHGGGVRGTATTASTASSSVTEAQQEGRAWSWRLPQAAMAVLKECLASSSLAHCVRAVVARALHRAARAQREIHLGAGLMLVPDVPDAKARRRPSRSLAASAKTAKAPDVEEALTQSLLSLLRVYSVRVRLPSARAIRDALDDSPVVNASAFSGRKRGGIGQLLVLGSSLLPVKMSMLALLVGKALMLSMLAFAIPALRLLQQGGGGGGGAGGGGGGGGHHCH